jgi:lipopolysaccharide export system ATP-binding protein
MLRVQEIRKNYGRRPVVAGICLAVGPGEVVGILGPNGAGKTTTFHMIVGLVPVDGGKIFLEDRDITRLPMHKRARAGIGYLPQEPSIFRKLTVRQNLQAVAEVLPISPREQESRIHQFLEELGIQHLQSQLAMTLSGGERRRLEIARSLLCNPKILLLDEPFSGVDPINVQEVQRIIRSLKEKRIGVLITDHNVRETLSIVDRAYLIYGGKVLAMGDRDFLLRDPASKKFYLGEDFASG